MHTSGPRRYSKFELCTTLQLQRLAEEFCYDTETLRRISDELQSRTSRQAKHVKKLVDRQVQALTAPPPPQRTFNIDMRWVVLAISGAVLLATTLDQTVQYLGLL